MTLLTRRSFAIGATALATVPATPVLAQTASRTFQFLRGDNPIGTHSITVEQSSLGLTAVHDIDIAVVGLGIITLYSYKLNCTETYDLNGNLMSLIGTCNDDGDEHFVNVNRTANALSVEGSSYSGPAPGTAGAASYWRQEALQRAPWISTQSGKLLPMTTSQIASTEAPAGATAYRATNGTDYTIDLFYDSQGEWVGSAFDAKGERATLKLISQTGALRG